MSDWIYKAGKAERLNNLAVEIWEIARLVEDELHDPCYPHDAPPTTKMVLALAKQLGISSRLLSGSSLSSDFTVLTLNLYVTPEIFKAAMADWQEKEGTNKGVTQE